MFKCKGNEKTENGEIILRRRSFRAGLTDNVREVWAEVRKYFDKRC